MLFLCLVLIFVCTMCYAVNFSKDDRYRVVSSVEELYSAFENQPENGNFSIVIRPGHYTINKTLKIEDKPCVVIEGSGWNTQLDKIGEGNAFEIINCGFAEIKNFILNGASSAKGTSGIILRGSSSCTIEKVRVSLFPESGIRYEGDPKSPMSSNTLKDCHFIENYGDQLYSYNNNDYYIERNQFGATGIMKEPCAKVGAKLIQSSAGNYTQNYHWENTVDVMIINSHYNRFENNRFEEARETGVILGDPNTDEISIFNIFLGNTFHTNSKSKYGAFPSFIAYNAMNTTFTSNQFFSWNAEFMPSSCLIVEKGCSDWIIKDNILKYSANEPLIVSETAKDMIISDNIIKEGFKSKAKSTP